MSLFAPPLAQRRRLIEGLTQEPVSAARFLLGQVLLRRIGRRVLAARIVETEAYLGEGDPSAHSFRGRTRRTAPIWGPPGTIYVYFIYGMHHCLNIVADEEGRAGCVLIRAAEPLDERAQALGSLSGPGRLCRALRLDTRHSGTHLFAPDSGLTLREGRAPERIGVSTRIGIRRAAERPLRFFDASSAAVSK